MYTTRLPPYRRTDGVAHNSKSMWSTWPQSRGVKQQYFDEKEGGQENSNSATYHDLKKQKVTDCLLYMFWIIKYLVWRRKRIRINSSNLFDHFSCLECSSSTFAIIQISQRAPHSSAAIGRDFVLLVLYSILHNSRRLASYLLLYAGPSTSCFLQGVREQREGEAKGKLKRSARIYSRPDRGQKGEPCRPFSSRREHAKHITSWQGKWNQVKKEISIHHVVLIIKPWMWFIAQLCYMLLLYCTVSVTQGNTSKEEI